MPDIRFATSDQDRRRRMLATSPDSLEETVVVPEVISKAESSSNPVFLLLSRDQIIRRLISPRVWKTGFLACLLCGIPLSLVFMVLSGSKPPSDLSSVEGARLVSILRGISGLELFLAGQLCLLICWVRSASAVDFRGGYRAWRWISILLFGASFFLLTGAAPIVTTMIAEMLKPLLGSIEAARPALLIVPAGTFAAFALRYLLPDMGRCRVAQSLAIAAVICTLLRIVAGLRGPLTTDLTALGLLEFLMCGLTLSAAQMHCRYVIHVNPNPPVRSGQILQPVAILAADVERELIPTKSELVANAVIDDSEDKSESEPATLSAATEEFVAEQSSSDKKPTNKSKPSKKQHRKAG